MSKAKTSKPTINNSQPLTVAIGADHAGYELKEHLKKFLTDKGYSVRDVGTDSASTVDYPQFAAKVGRAVASKKSNQGIMICGSGIGAAIAANKVPGIRAANCNDPESARLSRAHNDANVLTLGARLVDSSLAEEIVSLWLKTEFEGGRHLRRVRKIGKLERK